MFVIVNTKRDSVVPLRSRIRDNDIMLIRHTYSGYLEDGCVCLRCVAVKLVIGSIIFNPRRIVVGALGACDDTLHTMQIVGGR